MMKFILNLLLVFGIIGLILAKRRHREDYSNERDDNEDTAAGETRQRQDAGDNEDATENQDSDQNHYLAGNVNDQDLGHEEYDDKQPKRSGGALTGARQGYESYGQAPSYSQPSSYGYQSPVYIPVPITSGKKKKSKIISVVKGMYVQGGQQVFGVFKSAKACMKYCSSVPSCFGGDYNKWLYKCYIQTNITACGALIAHPASVHFSKVPCTSSDVNPSSNLVILGVQLALGMELKGVDDLKSCIKKCVSAGNGIPPTNTMANLLNQICFAIVFDFSSHKCYVFTNNNYGGNLMGYFCSITPPVNTPVQDLTPNPNTIFIDFCPPLPAPIGK